MLKMIRQGLLASAIGIGLLAGPSHATVALPSTTYSGLVIFGDSISDTGNVLSLTNTFTPATPFPVFPGAEGRFSNGPVWTEHLAAGLGFASSANPSNLFYNPAAPNSSLPAFIPSGVLPIGALGGQNFSFGGARTGRDGSAGNGTGLLGQLVAWDNPASIVVGGPLTRAADPNALYVVVAGANDLRDFRSGVAGAPDPTTVAGNVVGALNLLANAGARHFLISSLPDLGLTPEAASLGLVAQSTAATLEFNSALSSLAGSFEAVFNPANGVDLDIRMLDFFGLVNQIAADATNNDGLIYGITNITTPCIVPAGPGAYFVPGATGPECGSASFSDDLHPSAASHALLGDLAVQVATAPVPEPAEYAMLIAGLLVVGTIVRRRRAVAAA